MNLKRGLFLLAMAVAGTAVFVSATTVHGGEVIFNVQSFTGAAQTRQIVIRQTDDVVATGTALTYDVAKVLRPVSGVATTNLLAGAYDVYLDPLPKSIRMVVPDGAGPFDAIDLVSGVTAYGASNRVFYTKEEIDAMLGTGATGTNIAAYQAQIATNPIPSWLPGNPLDGYSVTNSPRVSAELVTANELLLGKTNAPAAYGRMSFWSEENSVWLPLYAEDFNLVIETPVTSLIVPGLSSSGVIRQASTNIISSSGSAINAVGITNGSLTAASFVGSGSDLTGVNAAKFTATDDTNTYATTGFDPVYVSAGGDSELVVDGSINTGPWGVTSGSLTVGTNLTVSSGANPSLRVDAGSPQTLVVSNNVASFHSNAVVKIGSVNFGWIDPVNNSQMLMGAGLSEHTSSVGVGMSALSYSPGSYNSAMGRAALSYSPGSYNSAMGMYTLSYSTGSYNSAMGMYTLSYSTGSYNSAMGRYTLSYSPGSYNSAIGSYALYSSPGSYNSAIGSYALYLNKGSSSATFTAQSNYNSLVWLVVGSGHGISAGNVTISACDYAGITYIYATNIYTDVVCITNAYKSYITSGTINWGQMPNNNTAIGNYAGYYLSSGVSNLYIGNYAGPSSETAQSNKLYIANKAGTPLIGGDFAAKTVSLDGSLLLSALAAEPSAVPGYAQLYAATNTGVTEMFVQGDDGTETQISPHADDAPATFYDLAAGDMKEIVWREANPFLTNGRVSFINMRRMARITELNTRAILYLAGNNNSSLSNALVKLKGMSPAQRQVLITETFPEYNSRTGRNLQPLIWEDVEQARQVAYDAERVMTMEAYDRILAENLAKEAAGDTNIVELPTIPPDMDVRRPKPIWMK